MSSALLQQAVQYFARPHELLVRDANLDMSDNLVRQSLSFHRATALELFLAY
mgnify:CR=1 FL=1